MRQGTYSVVHEAIDKAGNRERCAFSVTVVDEQAPVIRCPANQVVYTSRDSCSVRVTFPSATATDPCTGTPVAVSQTFGPRPGSTLKPGTYFVGFLADDGRLRASCNFRISVLDRIPPSISCPADVTGSAKPGRCAAVLEYSDPSIVDNCNAATWAPLTPATASGSEFPVGSTSVTLVATDAAGNRAQCVFSASVGDGELPAISCPADVSVVMDKGSCTAVVKFLDATATDNCPGTNVVQTGGPSSGSDFAPGVTTVSFEATDAAGNTASCSFTVTVADNQVPTIVCPADISVNVDKDSCAANVQFANARASDNCGRVRAAQAGGPSSGSDFAPGVTTVSFEATDATGNTASCSFKVTVADNQAPSIVCPADVVVGTDAGACTAVARYDDPSVSDNCAEAQWSADIASGSIFELGATTVTLSATDAAGNTQSCTFKVTVVDDEAPSISCPTDISGGTDDGVCSAILTYDGPTFSDNCPGVSWSASSASGSAFALGDTAVELTATDAAGNSQSCSFTATVTDDEAPAIRCPADVKLGCLSEFFAADILSVAVTDNCGASTVTVERDSSNGASGCSGNARVVERTYQATDAAGNTQSCSQIIAIEATPVAVTTSGCTRVWAGLPGLECATFAASVTGGCPAADGYGLSWDSGEAGTDNTQCPAATSSYVATAVDSQSCTGSATHNVEANDMACDEDGEAGFYMCDRGTSKCVSWKAAPTKAGVNNKPRPWTYGRCDADADGLCAFDQTKACPPGTTLMCFEKKHGLSEKCVPDGAAKAKKGSTFGACPAGSAGSLPSVSSSAGSAAGVVAAVVVGVVLVAAVAVITYRRRKHANRAVGIDLRFHHAATLEASAEGNQSTNPSPRTVWQVANPAFDYDSADDMNLEE